MKKILIIEDEPEMRRNITTILRLEGFQPVAAENGRKGVDLATKEKPDLILCDVMMPELDGYGVIKALHNEPETMNIPFIFLTAKGEKTDIRGGMNLGADDYLTKPFHGAELMARVHSSLGCPRQNEWRYRANPWHQRIHRKKASPGNLPNAGRRNTQCRDLASA